MTKIKHPRISKSKGNSRIIKPDKTPNLNQLRPPLSNLILDLVNQYGLYQFPVNRANFYTPLEEAISDLGIELRIALMLLADEAILIDNEVEHYTKLYGLLVPIKYLEADGQTGYCKYVDQVLVSQRGIYFLNDVFRYIGICK